MFLFSMIFTFHSCFPTTNPLYQFDEINNEKRFKLRFKPIIPYHERGSLTRTSIHVLKTIDQNNHVKYSINNYITLKKLGFDLKDTLYIMVQDTFYPIAYTIVDDYYNPELIKKGSETKDGNKVIIKEEIIENPFQRLNLSYDLSEEVVTAIKNSTYLNFRYYYGPNMITAETNKIWLRKFKQLILTNYNTQI